MTFALMFALLQGVAPVQGTVRAEGSLEPIPYATVEVVGTDRRAAADVRGFFALAAVPEGRWTIRSRALGYAPATQVVDIRPGTTLRLEILLTRLPVTIAAVRVDEEADDREVNPVGPPPIRLDALTLRTTPALAEVDVLRALQILPSVQQASDFSSALYVRGGSPDQTLVALDGIPLFNPYHLGGIFAAIDPDAVASLDLWAGAIPARSADRLSGVVQIWTREGARDRTHSRGSIGLISSRASMDGPLPGGNGSYLVSARRTYLDLFTRAVKAAGWGKAEIPYHFTDAHVKVVHDVGALGRLSASAYYNQEQFHVRDDESGLYDDDFDWGSRAASLEWRQPMGGRFLLEARAGFSSFRSEIDFLDPVTGMSGSPAVHTMRGRVHIRDALASTGLTWFLSDHEIRAGTQLDAYQLKYDIDRADDSFFSDLLPEFERTDPLTSVAAFVEDEWRVHDAVRLRLGVRSLHSGGASALMPRVGASWRISPRLTLELGGGGYAQSLNSFRNEESILASFLAYDMLTPSDSIGLARSKDVVVGGEWRSGATSVRLDAYAKQFTDLPMPVLPADPFEAPLLEVERMERGTGSAQGLDLLVRRDWGERRTLFASYALARASRTLGGETFTPRFERRHTVDLLGSFPLGKRTDGAVRLVASSGQSHTPVVGRFVPFAPGGGALEPSYGTTFILGEHNSARLPGYLRLDLSLRRTSNRTLFGREGTLTWGVQVLNALNTRNVLAALPDQGGEHRGGQLNFLPQLPVLPTFSLEWSF